MPQVLIKRLPLLCAVLLISLLVCRTAIPSLLAHGIGKPQVLNQPAGAYLISAWTDPDPLRTDETHVVVAVADPATNEMIVAGLEVIVRLTSLDNPGQVVAVVAGTDNVNQLLYAAEFNDLLSEGRWRADVTVTGNLGTSDEVTFEIDIEPARGFNWLWAGIGGLALMIVVWMAGSLRDNKPRSNARQGPGAGG